MSSTFSWTGGATSSPTEVVTGTDNVGNANPGTTRFTFVNDSTAPVNSLSLTNQSGGGSVISGNTVYYHGSTTGSFTITNALTDAEDAGPASSSYPTLGGTTTGWSHTANTDTSSPYVSNTFTWSSGRPAHRPKWSPAQTMSATPSRPRSPS